MIAAVILICHASTAALRSAAFPEDEPLDRFGERDCGRLANQMQASRIRIAPERRTRQTAKALGLPGEIAHALRDCDYGRWAGRPLASLAEEEPEAVAAWLSDPDAAPHGGESQRQVLERVAAWLDADIQQTGRTIVITHPMVIRAALVHAIGAGADALHRINVAPLSEAVISRTDRWRLSRLGPITRRPSGPAVSADD